jgi:hypothetical protein
VKRLLATTALAVLAAAGLAACAGDQAALTVDGEEVLSVEELQDQLDELAEADDALTALDGRGTGNDTLSAGFVSTVLDNHVLLTVLEREVADQDLELTDDVVEAGTEILTQNLANPPQGGIPLEVDQIPGGYRQTLIDLFANYTALIVAGGGNPADPADPANQPVLEAIQQRLVQLRAEADVEVAARYGRWDTSTERPGVAPPEGPVPVTTAPLVVPGG